MIEFASSAPSEMSAVWTTLAHDLRVPVAVVSIDGLVEFANGCYARAIEQKGPLDPVDTHSVTGKNIVDLFPGSLGTERLEMIKLAARSDRPLLIVQMVCGRWMRTVMRPLLKAHDQPCTRVLIVMRQECAGESGNLPGDAERYHIVHASSNDAGRLGKLSARELQVLTLIGEGLSTADIAFKLSISPKTIEWHRGGLGKKLRVKTRLELAQIALSAGLSSNGPQVKMIIHRRGPARH